MEKSYEDLCREIKNFKSLKSEDRAKELISLEARVEALQKEIASNQKTLDETQKKCEKKRVRIEAIKKEFLAIQEKRQNAVAFDQEVRELNDQIKELKEEKEFLEDTFPGIERRLEDLKTEGDLLAEEKVQTEKMILRFKLVPLVARYNDVGEKVAAIISEIYRIEEKLGEPFGGSSSGFRTVMISDPEGVEVVPQLFLLGCIESGDQYESGKLKDIFRLREFWYAEREKQK